MILVCLRRFVSAELRTVIVSEGGGTTSLR